MSTVKKPGFHKAVASLVENKGSVAEYKKLWGEYFTDSPTQEHINTYQNSIDNEHHDENNDDDSYEDSYDESYSY